MADNKRVSFPNPQRPENYENLYADTPDFGACPDCPDCGTTMGFSYSKMEFKCPDCGRVADVGEAMLFQDDEPDGDEIPFVCRTCGGPWPDCRTSCKMFDD